MRRTTIPSVLLSMLAGVASAAAPLPDRERLDVLLQRFDVPGVSLAGLDGCAVGDTLVAGRADLQRGTPVAARTAFEAASLSKPVFAWLVMALVEEGAIELDRPLAETFDYPRIPDKAAYAKITPRMVLTHRTGLPNWVGEDVPFASRTTPIPFKTPPGTAYSYSGEAFQLLQAFVERASGRPLQQLFHERLGAVMPDSTFARPLPGTVSPSRGYARASDPAGGRGMDHLHAQAMAASSLVTTAGDYARFLSHVCRREGLRAETYEEMLRPQSPLPREAFPVPASYGLGWLSMTFPDGELLGHGGDNDEYRAFAGFSRARGHGIAVFANGARGEAMITVMLLPSAPP